MIKQFCYISKSKWFKDFIRCPRYSIEVQNNNGQKFIDKYNKKKKPGITIICMTKLLIRLDLNLYCWITMDKNKCKEILQIRNW